MSKSDGEQEQYVSTVVNRGTVLDGERPAMYVDKGFFKSREDVDADIKKTGFSKTMEIKSPVNAGELPLHWHGETMISYVLEGSQYIVIDDKGTRVTVEKGDRMVLTAGALHAEGLIETGVTYLVTRKDTGTKLKDVLQMHKPSEPMDSTNPDTYDTEAGMSPTDRAKAAFITGSAETTIAPTSSRGDSSSGAPSSKL